MAVHAGRRSTRAASSGRSSASPTASGISASSARRPSWRDCSSRSPPRRRGASARGRGGSRSPSRSSSAGCCSCPRRSSRSASATRPSPGTSRTTRRTRSRSPATSSCTDTPRTATTTGARASSASTRPRRTRRRPFDRAARHHFAYFPGTALTAAAWRVLPRPWDDYRIFVLLATLALLPAALVFPGALYVRLAVGTGLAANPILLKGAWFRHCRCPRAARARPRLRPPRSRCGSSGRPRASAPRSRSSSSPSSAVPFFAVMLLTKHASRATLYRAGAAFGGVFLATVIPFLIADPRRAVARHGLLRRRHVPHRRLRPRRAARSTSGRSTTGSGTTRSSGSRSCFWLPLTAWLPLGPAPRRNSLGGRYRLFRFDVRPALLSRVFQSSYLAWPLTGIGLCALARFELTRTSSARMQPPELLPTQPRNERVHLVPAGDVDPPAVRDERRVLAVVEVPDGIAVAARSAPTSRAGRSSRAAARRRRTGRTSRSRRDPARDGRRARDRRRRVESPARLAGPASSATKFPSQVPTNTVFRQTAAAV